MKIAALIPALMMICSTLAIAESSQKIENILGKIVAYSSEPACLNGNASWSMLIHLRGATAASKYVEVRFSLLCDDHPRWLTTKSREQKFRLTRDKASDSVLTEFLGCSPDSIGVCLPLPIWKLVPGAETEKLPFGVLVPSYRSVDLPMKPAV